jgi:hypothetical protein
MKNRFRYRSYRSSRSLSVARAYPDGDARNYRNTAFIRAHFEINRCIRNLKADLGVNPSDEGSGRAGDRGSAAVPRPAGPQNQKADIIG